MTQHPFREHDQRRQLALEVHARPYAPLSAPERATHIALYSGEEAGDKDREEVAALCRRLGAQPPEENANAYAVDLGDFRLKWERHTEFSTFTFYCHEAVPDEPFTDTVIERVPRDWLEGLPGEFMVGIHVEVDSADKPERSPEEISQLFAPESFAGAEVAGGAALAFMDFWVNEDGFGRLLVHDRNLHARQAGRLIQRLLEIETYRTFALLAFPLAKDYSRDISRIGRTLTELTGEMRELKALEDERKLLESLTRLAAETEQIAAETTYRFGAAGAYYELVVRRLKELRESRLEGYQEFGEFMERRLTPAIRTCESVAGRLDTLSKRITRAGQLLRTRVDIQVEEQNRSLLQSMDRRASLQLRLQETVEGLSIAAISYYVVGLVAYLAKALEDAGVPIGVNITTGLSVPVVIGLAWIIVRRVRRMVARQEAKCAAADTQT
ncbi:MAG: DUF3422 domain-containing protein [Rhodovibrionaceae bacterium]|nr:DUF3422 domain-containing protein [Rhodovibrionaceae bacterium]